MMLSDYRLKEGEKECEVVVSLMRSAVAVVVVVPLVMS